MAGLHILKMASIAVVWAGALIALAPSHGCMDDDAD